MDLDTSSVEDMSGREDMGIFIGNVYLVNCNFFQKESTSDSGQLFQRFQCRILSIVHHTGCV